MSDETPVRRQYLNIKRQYPDTIVFFRLGDFYETFDDDASICHKELGLYLTSKPMGKDIRVPLAGIPYHAVEEYLAKLVGKGYKVAIVEQMTEPGVAKLVEREVVRVVTPGTVVEPRMLEPKRNNFVAAVWLEERQAGLAYTDITTGEFLTTSFSENNQAELMVVVRQELGRIGPREVLAPKKPYSRRQADTLFGDEGELDALRPYEELTAPVGDTPAITLTPFESLYWNEDAARTGLMEHFEVGSLEGFGCADLPMCLRAAGAVVAYLKETQRATLAKLNRLQTYSTKNYMVLDVQTRRNLELIESTRTGNRRNSLIAVLDRTTTDMGGRLLRKWLSQPLIELAKIEARQEAVAAFSRYPALRDGIVEILKQVADIERKTQRISQGIAAPRELLELKLSLELIPPLLSLFDDASEEVRNVFKSLLKRLNPCEGVVGMVGSAIVDEPPRFVGRSEVNKERGETIRQGYSEELDNIKESIREAKVWVASLEKDEIARTGIKSLKVSFNKVFGYYIEVTTSNLSLVPSDYIRKQTIANGERYITGELKEKESLILSAQERIDSLEIAIYKELLREIATHSSQLLAIASALAHLDVFASLSLVAEHHNYVRPVMNEGATISIKGGRHPVVEAANPEAIFVPNDLTLNSQGEQIAIITGPNMAGKSTYMRQVALIVLMAQIGAFVPADTATIGIVDRIFTRVGAQDDIATGQSTFMVEMTETSYILSHSTPRSLIILDEVGRGTSTYDGLAIAQAVVEYIHNNPRCGAKTLFATHYHELIELASVLPRVRNYNVAVTEEGGKIIFLRKLIPGGADRSYGIHVAQLAGLPRSVVHRAEELLEKFEQGDHLPDNNFNANGRRNGQSKNGHAADQLNLFANGATATLTAPHPLIEDIANLNVMELSPIEAINKLYELQQKAKGT